MKAAAGRHRAPVTAATLAADLGLTGAPAYVGRHRPPPECDCCGMPCPTPVRDPTEVSWVGAGARSFCSPECLAARTEQQTDADGAS